MPRRSEPCSRRLTERGGSGEEPGSRRAVEAFHQFGNRVTRGTPLGLIAEDHGIRSEPRELGHGRHDEIVFELAAPSAVNGPRDQVSTNQVEWRHPATDPDSRPFAEALEVVVVADGDTFMLGDVTGKVDPLAWGELA